MTYYQLPAENRLDELDSNSAKLKRGDPQLFRQLCHFSKKFDER